MILTIIIFLILLSVLVLIHEGGHFLAAKAAGIGVEEFGLGLPPRLVSKKIGETIYSLNLLPFGGFVRLVGEDPTDLAAERSDSFYNKSLLARAQVILAGVFANFLLGVFIFYLVLAVTSFKADLPQFFPHQFRFVNQTPGVAVIAVEAGSPASDSGLRVAEVIDSVDGVKITSILQLRQELSARKGREITLDLLDSSGKPREIKARLRTQGEGLLGVNLTEFIHLEYKTLLQKIFSGFTHSANIIEYSGKIFGGLVWQSLAERKVEPLSQGVAGPVGIAQVTQQIISLGILPTLQFAALLSLNLAVINILPFPALDGGRLVFLGAEAVFRRKLHPKFEKWLNSAGFAILLGLILVITYNDVLRILR